MMHRHERSSSPPRPPSVERTSRASGFPAWTLLLTAGMAAGCTKGGDEILERHREAFPLSDHVIDVPERAWPSGAGQLEMLSASIAASGSELAIVELGGSWCPPCIASYPDFIRAAGDARPELLFMHVGVELDHPDYEGLKHFVQHRWNRGVEPGFPSYALLTRSLEPAHVLMFNDLEEALDAAGSGAPKGPTPGSDASDIPDCVDSESAYAAMLASTEPRVIRLDSATTGEFAKQLEDQTGLRILMPPELAGRFMKFKMETLHLGAVSNLRGPYHFLAVPGGPDYPPMLVLWDRTVAP